MTASQIRAAAIEAGDTLVPNASAANASAYLVTDVQVDGAQVVLTVRRIRTNGSLGREVARVLRTTHVVSVMRAAVSGHA